MARACVVCGRDITEGTVCLSCDSRGKRSEPVETAPEPLPMTAKTAADILAAVRIPCAVISGESKAVRVASEEVRQLLGIEPGERRVSLRKLESRLGTKLPPLGEPFSTRLTFGSSEIDVSMVPLAGGADGAVLIFHRDSPLDVARRSGIDAVYTHLRALREALTAAEKHRATDPLLDDTASTVDRIVAVLDSPPPQEDWTSTQPHKLPGSIPQVVRQAAARYLPIAELKGIQLHVDLPEINEVVRDAAELEDCIEILLENAIFYVPQGGQIFAGARTTEQKGRPVALFFVMDNGPCVPEELKSEIFLPEFRWDPAGSKRTGRNLSFCYTFAARHGGQCWVDTKPGKSCTFFLSMRIL